MARFRVCRVKFTGDGSPRLVNQLYLMAKVNVGGFDLANSRRSSIPYSSWF